MPQISQMFYGIAAVTAAYLVASCSTAHGSKPNRISTPCITTNIGDLWRDPKRFTNKRVCLSGYLGRMVAYGEDSPKIYATESEAQATKLERFATLGIPFTIPVQERLSRYALRKVQVEGIVELEFPCGSQPTSEPTDSLCSPPPSLRIAKARLQFADGTQFP